MVRHEFNGRESYFRLRQLQDLCKPASLYPCILLVGGADGAFNKQSQSLLKYLFLGKSGQDLLGEQVIEEYVEALEDTVILITYCDVSIYYNPDVENIVVPIISHWRNVTEYRLPRIYLQDTEKWENYKIQAFVIMIEGQEKIGLPINSSDQMVVEKWPLIQAFGLDDHQRGFFTMSHTVMDATNDIQRILALPDEYSAKVMMCEGQKILQQHWSDFLRNADHAEHPYQRTVKSEEDFGEDILSFYEFGIVRHAAKGLAPQPDRGARVLFGTRSSNLEAKSGRATAEDSGVGNFPATHFIVQGEDPATGLRVARTYFLATGKCAERIVDDQALVHNPNEVLDKYANEPDNSVDTLLLTDLYVLLLTVLESASETYIESVQSCENAASAAKAARSTIGKVTRQKWHDCMRSQKSVDEDFVLDYLVFNTEYFNAFGEKCEYQANEWNQVYISLCFPNVPSQVVVGKSIGSIIAGDTYVFTNAAYQNATAGIPTFRSWIHSGKEAAFLSNLDDVLLSEHMLENVVKVGKEIGEILTIPHMLFGSEILPSVSGTLRAYQTGFVFRSPAFNPIVVSFRSIVENLLLVSTEYDDLMLFIVQFKDKKENPVTKSVQIPLESTDIALPIHSGTEIHSTLIGLINTWKSVALEFDIPFFTPTDTNETQNIKYEVHSVFTKGQHIVADPHAAILDEHLFPRWIIPRITPLQSSWTSSSYSKKMILPISILIGIPGSDVESIAQSIVELSGQSNNWIKIAANTPNLLELESISTAIQEAIKEFDQLSSHTQRPRIMLVAMGFVEPMSIVKAVEAVKVCKRAIKISSLTTVINALNVFSAHQQMSVLPKVLDQLAPGFADNIVVTRTSEATKEEMNNLRYRIAHINPDAELLCLSTTVFEGSIEPLLVLDNFETAYKMAYRNYLYPHWNSSEEAYLKYHSSISSNIGTIRFRLNGPLDKTRFLTFIGALTPQSSLRTSISTVHPVNTGKESELSGIRLAQSLAKTKVQQKQVVQASKDEAAKLASESNCGKCWSVSAIVSCAEMETYEYLATETKSTFRIASSANLIPEIVFTGQHLQQQGLETLLLECFPVHHTHSTSKLKTMASLTPQEKAQIQKERAYDPLPDGYVYDGTNYYDFTGQTFTHHPNLSKYLQAYIEEWNASYEKNNKQAKQEHLQAKKQLQCIT